MWPYVLIALAFAADRLSKWWVAAFLADNGVTRLNAWLTLRETYNRGLAFGLLQGIGPIMGWLSILIVLGLLLYLTQVPRQEWLLRAGLALIIGGALGNLIDRITAGQVLDFIQTPLRSGIFNVADVCINLGLILVLAGLLLHRPTGQPGPESEPPPTT
ncbi:MAG: signal peptidase II [Candidatus Promineifilaceae bacterium]|nr:signal peptidase II [Candidatus Promineifilaceae bacterium]